MIINIRHSLYLLLLFVLISCEKKEKERIIESQQPGCIEEIVTVDPNVRFQTISGFGASDCWMSDFVGKNWVSGRNRISELLFSKEIVDGQPLGIGLSMWRTNLGGGTAHQGDASGIGDFTRRAESYLNDDLTYDWNRCSGQRYFLNRAKDFKCESIVLFSNTPLIQFTKNGLGYSESWNHANLKEDSYDDFAAYIAEVANYYKTIGYPITHISPVNEPQYNWDSGNQEGSGWQNSEVAHLVKELDVQLTAKNVDVDILLGEVGNWLDLYKINGELGRSMVMDAFFNKESSDYIGNLPHVPHIISGHSYWTDDSWNNMRKVRRDVARSAAKYGLKLWQTEWSMLGDEYSSEEFIGYELATEMDIALYMAKVIHNDLTQAQVTSWSYWTSMDIPRWGHKNRFLLIALYPRNDDIRNEGTFVPCPTLWVLGNYSLFIKPGYRRIALKYNESRYFFGNAWISPEEDKIVLVFANLSYKHIKFVDKYENVRKGSMTVYTTSAEHSLEEKLLKTEEQPVLLPKSVTTIIVKLK